MDFKTSDGRRFFRNQRWTGLVAVTTALAISGFLGLRAATLHEANNPPANVKVLEHYQGSHHGGYAAVVKQVLPAVVSIESTKMVKQQESGQLPDDFFRQFFGDQFGNQQFGGNGNGGGRQFNMPREQKEQGLGSGVIVSANGYILTNNHVVDGSNDILVTLKDGRQFKGRVVGTDSRTDIAVVKIEANSLPTLALADSAKLDVGDVVLAVGNPFGVGETVTEGIVSATGRHGLGIEQLEDFIQTDAAINPGNSGGALVDEQGNLVGINTAIVGNSGGNVGIGFAVPINLAKHDMDSILAHGKVERGYLGVHIQPVTPALSQAFNSSVTGGALIADVTPGSPAAAAGLKSGDIVTQLNGSSVSDNGQLQSEIGTMNPGTQVNLTIMRNGQTMNKTVTLGDFPENEQQAGNNGRSFNRGDNNTPGSLKGVSVDNVTPETARQFNINRGSHGVVVTNVDPDSAASDAHLQAGDVILEVNHQAVDSVSAFNRAVTATPANQPVLLLVNSGQGSIYIAVPQQ